MNHCISCGSAEHGKPVFAPIPGIVLPHVSISYAEDLAVMALTEAGPVGVDVERADAASFRGYAEVAAHDEEVVPDARTRTTNWVRKESLLKATGQGLTVDPRQIRLSNPNEPPSLVAWAAADPPSEPVWMFDAEITGGYVASVTVLSTDRPHLEIGRADLATRSR
jgi:4'-phosphopantetheinyl transferase